MSCCCRPGLKWDRGICVPLAMPCLSLMPIMSCLHLCHPALLARAANHYWGSLSRMRRGICLAAVLAPGDGAHAPQLLAWGGFPMGTLEAWCLGPWWGQGRLCPRSGCWPIALASVLWLIPACGWLLWDTSHRHSLLLVLGWQEVLRAVPCAAALMKMSALSKEWQSNKWFPR